MQLPFFQKKKTTHDINTFPNFTPLNTPYCIAQVTRDPHACHEHTRVTADGAGICSRNAARSDRYSSLPSSLYFLIMGRMNGSRIEITDITTSVMVIALPKKIFGLPPDMVIA
jgi:hypothetical protein